MKKFILLITTTVFIIGCVNRMELQKKRAEEYSASAITTVEKWRDMSKEQKVETLVKNEHSLLGSERSQEEVLKSFENFQTQNEKEFGKIIDRELSVVYVWSENMLLVKSKDKSDEFEEAIPEDLGLLKNEDFVKDLPDGEYVYLVYLLKTDTDMTVEEGIYLGKNDNEWKIFGFKFGKDI